jgi:hypothetical protein
MRKTSNIAGRSRPNRLPVSGLRPCVTSRRSSRTSWTSDCSTRSSVRARRISRAISTDATVEKASRATTDARMRKRVPRGSRGRGSLRAAGETSVVVALIVIV